MAGVGLFAWLHQRPRAARAVDRIVLVLVPPLVAFPALSELAAEGEVLPLLATFAGFGLVYGVEKLALPLAKHSDDVALAVGVTFLGFHALLEGGALLPESASTAFLVAVILHRVAVGLLVWWVLEPKYGPILAAGGVLLIPIATAIGYALGSEVLPHDHESLKVYEAFVAGTLLHVVFHQGRQQHSH